MNGKKDKKKSVDLNKIIAERDEYKNRYLRALADYQNFEKRVKEEKEALRNNASSAIILSFLPILDDLEKAEVFIKDEGLKLVKERLEKSFEEMGLEEVEVLGKEYDPHFAEAIEVVSGEKDDIVAEVLRKGYKLNGALLRPAQVKVSKKQ